ncbi:acyltransferase [Duganella sp. BJB488]|uniref:acyltransferase family protein n=1 Tax=unclassified Duganella TaxID=2636909 RepID=UPI000E34AEBA|nr:MULTISPECIES: acyltransferase [unclassified Duganella]NVD73956.1 acyltransferase [Duganella sp. BJB1802]RFP12373.1 acyltransferase [Duganella sp. BJB489]RFP16533.1 acyltransferase [Duganella sp. BJB488]RFP30737.1 acyltransferase [Duganella sp. BJB480]
MLKALQAGRALAAIAVAAFHLSISMGIERYGGKAVFGEYTRFGDHGVDFFFVLSGFIILFAHVDDIGRPEKWAGYIRKRFIRLFPIYWVYSVPFIVLLLLGFGTDAKLPTTLADWVTDLTLVRFTNAPPILPPSWTLFHEIAFYAIFSLLIVKRQFGIAAFALFMAGCLAHYNFPAPEARTPLNVYTGAYNFYFIFGMGAYWLYTKGGSGARELLAGLVLAGLGLAMGDLPYRSGSLVLGLAFAFILAGVTKLELAGWIRVPNVLNYIGNASYSIYLIHEALEGLLLKVVLRTGIYGKAGAAASYGIVLAGTVALGCLAYAVVEKPLLDFLRKRTFSNKVRLAHGVKP